MYRLWQFLCKNSVADSSELPQPEQPISYLGSKQRHLIVQSWAQVTDQTSLGQHIYMQIFMHKPQLIAMFPFRGIPASQLHLHASFSRMAAAFAKALHSIVHAVEANDEAELRSLCQRVGGYHTKVGVMFEANWWTLFGSSVLDCMTPYCSSASPAMLCQVLPGLAAIPKNPSLAIQAWAKLMEHVIHYMEEAFNKYNLLLLYLVRRASAVPNMFRPSLVRAPGTPCGPWLPL